MKPLLVVQTLILHIRVKKKNKHRSRSRDHKERECRDRGHLDKRCNTDNDRNYRNHDFKASGTETKEKPIEIDGK